MSHLCTFFFVNREGYRLRFYPSSLSGALWVDPLSRSSDNAFFKSYLRPGDVVIDVGANIGITTLEASVIVGDSGKVFAVEAHPRIFKYLQGNVKLNRVKNVHAHNVALGNTRGTVLFANSKLDDQNSIITNGDGVKVSVCPLDSLPIPERPIALLKIDTEGYERFVFEGAKRTLQVIECIYFESWDQHFRKYGYTCYDLFELLKKYGFQIFQMHQNATICPVPPSYASESNENLLAIRSLDKFLRRTHFIAQGSGRQI